MYLPCAVMAAERPSPSAVKCNSMRSSGVAGGDLFRTPLHATVGGIDYLKQVVIDDIGQVTSAYMSLLRTGGKAKRTLQKIELVQRRVLELASRRKAKSILDIDLSFIDAYRAEAVARKIKPAQPKTVLNETVIIRQMVNFALSRNLIHSDPLRNLKLNKVKPKSQPCWARAEVEQILAAAEPPHRWAW